MEIRIEGLEKKSKTVPLFTEESEMPKFRVSCPGYADHEEVIPALAPSFAAEVFCGRLSRGPGLESGSSETTWAVEVVQVETFPPHTPVAGVPKATFLVTKTTRVTWVVAPN